MQKRPVGRPKIAKELKKVQRKFYLNDEENKIVKEFVKCLKERKQAEKQS